MARAAMVRVEGRARSQPYAGLASWLIAIAGQRKFANSFCNNPFNCGQWVIDHNLPTVIILVIYFARRVCSQSSNIDGSQAPVSIFDCRQPGIELSQLDRRPG